MSPDASEADRLRSCSGPSERIDLLGQLFREHLDKLTLAVRLRLSPRLARRVSVADVLQDAYIDAQQRLEGYLVEPRIPFHVWLRLITIQRLKTLYRRHGQAQVRDFGREVPLRSDTGSWDGRGPPPVAARTSPPSEITFREERKSRFHAAFDRLAEPDRELIRLRNFEQLSFAEAALLLGVPEPTVRQRHSRALKKLKEHLRAIVRDRSGFWQDRRGTWS